MEMNRASLRVGAFVLAGAVCVVALFFFLSGGFSQSGVIYESYFGESVQGLDIGTAVKYRGVPVGNVTYLGLVALEYGNGQKSVKQPKPYRKILVRYRLNLKKVGSVDIEKAVSLGLRAQIKPQGITGLSYIDLSFVNPETFPPETIPWKPIYPVIPAIPSTLTQVQDAVEKFFKSLDNVDFGRLSENVTQLLATLNQQMDSGDAHEALANLNALLANLNGAVRQSDLPATAASIRDLAGGPQTQQILASLDRISAQLAQTSAQLPALVASSQAAINQANETTADVQAQLGPILQSMQATTNNLRDLSASLAANPGQILAAPPPPPKETP
jgi:ABC-type transporter Mla subunit MlaD